MKKDYSELLVFALMLARAAEEQILPHYRRVDTRIKPDGTEVTIADRMAEKVMRTLIARRYPHDGILGEELGFTAPVAEERTWVLDPIDGTSWFAMGAPLFGTLVGLLEFGRPVLGVIHLPALQETTFAARGTGCWFKVPGSSAVRVRVAAAVPLHKATVLASGFQKTSLLSDPPANAFDLAAVALRAMKLKLYGDCVQHTLVCSGHVHAGIDTIMRPWDIAALVPCIEEAGGLITSLSGEQENIMEQQTILTSCCPGLHEELVRTLVPQSCQLALAG